MVGLSALTLSALTTFSWHSGSADELLSEKHQVLNEAVIGKKV